MTADRVELAGHSMRKHGAVRSKSVLVRRVIVSWVVAGADEGGLDGSIDEMDSLIDDIARNGEATTAEEAAARPGSRLLPRISAR